VGETGEHHVRCSRELRLHGGVDARLGMAVQIHPPRTDRIDIAFAVVIGEPHAACATNRQQRQFALVILHLRAGVPDVREIPRPQRRIRGLGHVDILA
jgi:hypothetical protein